MQIKIGQFLRKVHTRRAPVHKQTGIFLDKACRLAGNLDFFIRVDRSLFGVRFAGNFLHFLDRHGSAADTDNALLLLQEHEVAPKRHLRHVGEVFFELFKRQFAAFV